MNIVAVPFHDWRKCLREGFRTRDGHLIEHMLRSPQTDGLLVVNRPITYAEMLGRRHGWRTPGPEVFRTRRWRVVQVAEKGFVLDYLSSDVVRHVIRRKAWYFGAFASSPVADAVQKACAVLGFSAPHLLSLNILAAGLCMNLGWRRCVFDAWDNWLRFPANRRILRPLEDAYRTYAECARLWTTNSEAARNQFMSMFGLRECVVISNGVDPERFARDYPAPPEYRTMQRPIVLFGGKVSHLVDAQLLNHCVAGNPDKSFVMVGPILDQRRFRAIRRQPNLFYLGDRRYDDYPAYVRHCDVCILPYVVGGQETGQDSIKVYEYLAAGRPIVATSIAGMERFRQYALIAQNAREFSALISTAAASPPRPASVPREYTWESKAQRMLACLAGLPDSGSLANPHNEGVPSDFPA